MGFKAVADLDCETSTAIGGKNKETGKPNPTSITGYFIGTRQVDSKKSKTGFAALHVIQTPKGNVGVWGKTNLDRKMRAVPPGQMVRITFVGMVETRNNPMYKYKVEADAENAIEVQAPDTSESTSEEAEETSEDTGAEQEYTEETEEEEQALDAEEEQTDEISPPRAKAPKTPVATPDAARAAKVKALLNGKRPTQ